MTVLPFKNEFSWRTPCCNVAQPVNVPTIQLIWMSAKIAREFPISPGKCLLPSSPPCNWLTQITNPFDVLPLVPKFDQLTMLSVPHSWITGRIAWHFTPWVQTCQVLFTYPSPVYPVYSGRTLDVCTRVHTLQGISWSTTTVKNNSITCCDPTGAGILDNPGCSEGSEFVRSKQMDPSKLSYFDWSRRTENIVK